MKSSSVSFRPGLPYVRIFADVFMILTIKLENTQVVVIPGI